MTENMPMIIMEKYPQMQYVFRVLQQYKNQEEITIKCPKCKMAVVNEVEEVGVIEVNCKCGFLHYREKHEVV